MVRDGGKDDRFPAEGDGGASGASGQPANPSPQLTHELAKLLAASLAQNQASRGQSGGIATGSDLQTLASLVSAASGQRTLAPVFRDGLSALSYGPPQGRGAPGLSPEQSELPPDDEPMPIPSTWRQPVSHDDERWFRQQMGAAMLGLSAGLIIVVPAVLWLSGWLGPQKAKPAAAGQTAAAPIDIRAGDAKTKVQVRPLDRSSETASQYVTGSIESRPKAEARQPEPTPAVTAAKGEEPRPRIEELVSQAARRIETGDVTGARDMLAAVEAGRHGPVSFALAETYDPNMLAAWGSRGVAADVAKAKALYGRARDLGMARAQARLDALK